MEVHDCCGCKIKCKSKNCGKCKEKIQFNVRCPAPVNPILPPTKVDYRRYTVGGGSGSLANQYTVSVPAGTQFITIRGVGGGGGGGGILSEVFLYSGLGVVFIPQPISAGGAGSAGFAIESNRPYTSGYPNTLSITVGAAASTPTDPTTGFGVDGGDTIVSFTPVTSGWEDVCAFGGRGGNVGKSTGDGEGIAGDGADGALGGGGGGEITLSTFDPLMFTIISAGKGGNSKQGQDGQDGDSTKGGDGALTANSGSSGSTVPGSYAAGGGGGGGSSAIFPNTAGDGGPVGSLMVSGAGGDAKVQNTGSGGGACGLYEPTMAEVGTTVFCSGGRGAHGVVDVWFYIFPVQT